MELELLSVRESVELLSAVAQLDTSEVSPCLIEIVRRHRFIAGVSSNCSVCVFSSQAQLCGRLPVPTFMHAIVFRYVTLCVLRAM